MNPFAQRLANAYFRANAAHIEAGHGRLRKGQFMQQAYPGQHYKNEASARRQFNKVIKGETSGVKIERRGVPQPVKGPLLGGRQAGLWKVDVHFKHLDHDGQVAPLFDCEEHICEDDMHCAVRSFTMESMQYDRMEDVPYIYAILPPLIETKMREWIESGSIPPVYWDVATIVQPAMRSNLLGDRKVRLDSLEIE